MALFSKENEKLNDIKRGSEQLLEPCVIPEPCIISGATNKTMFAK